jgi:hypothetical protein
VNACVSADKQVAKAMTHAMELCGGVTKKEIF